MHDLEKSRLLSKLFSEELNTAEKESLDKWLSESNDHLAEKNTFQQVWEMSGNYEPDFTADTEKALARFKARTGKAIDSQNSPKVIRMRPGRLLVRVAAVFLLLLTATFLIKPDILSSEQTIVAQADRIENSALADGSIVWLNKNSKLNYGKNYGETERNVHLEGEAFFDVNHDPNKPFTVTTNKAKITVLGTSFNVRVSEDGNLVTLDVKTGLVTFESLVSDEKVKVKAGESAVYNAESNVISHGVSESNNINSWMDDIFSFNGTPLKVVFSDLGRHFDVEFNVENEAINDCKYTTSGEFKIEKLDEIIAVLEGAFPIQIEEITSQSYKVLGSQCK